MTSEYLRLPWFARCCFTRTPAGRPSRTACAVAVLFGSLATVGPLDANEVTAPRPNILLVMADDLGWSDIGCYGGEIPTPHIDALAAQGLRFTQFYNNAICGPTRASLLTGLYCQQTGHRGDHWNDPKDFNKCVLISELLRDAGYRTMMVGKWQGRDLALDRGFDRFFGPMCQAKISYFDEVENNPYYLDRQRWAVPDDFYLTEAINDHAERFLREAVEQDAPFFLYVAHIAPHWPLHARPADVDRHRDRYRKRGWNAAREARLERQRALGIVPAGWTPTPFPPGVPAWEEEPHRPWQIERMAVYAAQVEAIDQGLGRLLRVLDSSGKRDNTLVIFLSDNGAAPDGGLAPSTSGFGFAPDRANDRWRKDGVAIRPGSGPNNLPGPPDTFAAYGLAWATVGNTPFRGTKLTGYEGGIRTPLVVNWPAVIQEQGRVIHDVGHVFDLLPTCLELAGASYPVQYQGRNPLPLEGKSLVPLFHGQPRPGHEALCWSLPRHHAIRMGPWKGVKPKNDDSWRLFRLDTDGTETTDLADQHPEQQSELARRFEAWRRRVGAK